METPDETGARLVTALRPLQGRWTLQIVQALLDGPIGFNDLRRALGTVGPSTLTRRLGELDNAGIVRREVLDVTPPATRYALTPLGEKLRPVLDEIAAWARTHGARSTAHDEVADMLSLFQEKWTLELHCALLPGPRRFGELLREIGMNQATLSQRLDGLQSRGLVHRTTDGPGAAYAFTERGEGFHLVGAALAGWAGISLPG